MVDLKSKAVEPTEALANVRDALDNWRAWAAKQFMVLPESAEGRHIARLAEFETRLEKEEAADRPRMVHYCMNPPCLIFWSPPAGCRCAGESQPCEVCNAVGLCGDETTTFFPSDLAAEATLYGDGVTPVPQGVIHASTTRSRPWGLLVWSLVAMLLMILSLHGVLPEWIAGPAALVYHGCLIALAVIFWKREFSRDR